MVSDDASRVVALTPDGNAIYERAAPLWREAQSGFDHVNGTETVGALRRSLATMKVDGSGPHE